MGLIHEEVANEGAAVALGRASASVGVLHQPQYNHTEESSSRRGLNGNSNSSHERGVGAVKIKQVDPAAQKGFIEFCDCGSRSGSDSLSPPVQLYSSSVQSNDLEEEGVWEYGYPPVVASGRGGRTAGSGETKHGTTHAQGSLLKSLQSAGPPPSIIVGFDSPQSSPKSSPKLKPSVSREASYASLLPETQTSTISPRGEHYGPSARKTTSSPLASMLSSDQEDEVLELSAGEGETELCLPRICQESNTGRRNYGNSVSIHVGVPREFERDRVPSLGDGSNPVPIPGAVLRNRLGVVAEVIDGPVLTSAIGLNSRQMPHSGLSSAFSAGNPALLLEQCKIANSDTASRWSPSPRPGLSSYLSLSPLGPRWPLPSKGNEHMHGRFWESSPEQMSPPGSRLLNWTGDQYNSQGPVTEDEANAHTSAVLFDESGFSCRLFSPGTPRKQGLFWGGAKWSSDASSAQSMFGIKSPGGSAGPAIRRSLVGSFEESLLSGRLLAGKPCQVDINSCKCISYDTLPQIAPFF
jgi:hypothetical protein